MQRKDFIFQTVEDGSRTGHGHGGGTRSSGNESRSIGDSARLQRPAMREASMTIDQSAETPGVQPGLPLPYDRPITRLARATAGMTQIVTSRHRREMLAIEENHTSPIATVTSSTH